eukprot:2875721-Amphidinium_carterae.1
MTNDPLHGRGLPDLTIIIMINVIIMKLIIINIQQVDHHQQDHHLDLMLMLIVMVADLQPPSKKTPR